VLGIVALEETRIHHDAADQRWNPKPDDAPVVARRAAAAGLPTVHPLAPIGVLPLAPHRTPGLEQVLLGCEELVVGQQRHPTEPFGGDIN
jgi:hypothetical protein